MRTHCPPIEPPLCEVNTFPWLKQRWAIAAAATVLMILTGALYSWGIFTQPLLAAFHWSLATTTWTYALANFSLAVLGALLGGFWQDRVGPGRTAAAGIVLWGIGNLLAGLGMQAFGAPWLYLTYGLIGGTGAGMAYVASLATVSQWFPDRPGLAGGLAASGFGVGAVLYSQCVPRLPGFQLAAAHASALIARHAAQGPAGALGAEDRFALIEVFILSGLLFVLIGLPAAALLRSPQGPPGPRAAGVPRGKVVIAWGLAPAQLLRTARFYLLWLQLFANALAGVTIISNAVFILADITHRSPAQLAPLFGAVSICNAAGRLLWGWVADRIGCPLTFGMMFAIQSASLVWLASVHGLAPALTAVSLVLLCCGGGFGVMPAYNLRSFGNRHVGRNYGLLLTAWGMAGLLGPILTALLKDLTGSFAGMMPVIAGLLVLAMILPIMTRLPPAAGSPSSSTSTSGAMLPQMTLPRRSRAAAGQASSASGRAAAPREVDEVVILD